MYFPTGKLAEDSGGKTLYIVLLPVEASSHYFASIIGPYDLRFICLRQWQKSLSVPPLLKVTLSNCIYRNYVAVNTYNVSTKTTTGATSAVV